MSMIYVRAKADRAVREVPGGKLIPSDTYVRLPDSGRLRRMIEVHGDLELKPKEKKSDDK
jgi:hypothetical protein